MNGRTPRVVLTALVSIVGAVNGFVCSIVLMYVALIVGRGIAVEDDALRPWAQPFEGVFVFVLGYLLPILMIFTGAAIAGGWLWRCSAPSTQPTSRSDE